MGDRQPKRLRSFQVDDQVELRWLFHWRVGRLGPLEYRCDEDRVSPRGCSKVRPK